MKKSKLLFLAPCAALAATTPFITSCNKQDVWDGVQIVDDIIHTLDTNLQDPPEGCNDLISALKTLSKKDLQKELIFDLYSQLLISPMVTPKTLYSLYKEKYVTPIANINECTSEITDDNKLVSTFKGYINFVFIKDYEDSYKQNDFIQITLFVPNLTAEILSNWMVWYSVQTPSCICLIQQRIKGKDQPLTYSSSIRTSPDHPNRNNWKIG